jgi:hypothetical protein
MIGTSHPLHTHTRSSSYIKDVWYALCVVGGGKGATPYHTITIRGDLGCRILSGVLTGDML